jgi:hypothetical protein
MDELGFFGGQKYELLEDYKKPQTNLFEEFKGLMAGKVSDENLIVPLMNWSSNNKTNINNIQDVNRNFFFISKTVLNHQLFFSVNRNYKFIPYPKKAPEQELGFLIPYICKYYNWTEREYNFHKELINLEDPELHKVLDKKFAFEKDELKKLGIKREKIVHKFEKFEKTKGFF